MREERIRYRPGIDPKPASGTDWDRLRQMSDDEIDAAARSDPDAQPMSDEELRECFRPGALREARSRLGLTQEDFAKRFRIDLQRLRGWEEGSEVPGETARAYLRVIERNPQAVLAALDD